MKLKYRKMLSAWNRNDRNLRAGFVEHQLPPSVLRVMIAADLRSWRTFVRRGQVMALKEWNKMMEARLSMTTEEAVTSADQTSLPATTDESSPITSSSSVAERVCYSRPDLECLTRDALRPIARERGVKGYSALRKADLISAIVDKNDD